MKITDMEGMGGRLKMGQGCKIDADVEFDISANVTLGNDVAISGGVLILTHDHDPADITKKHASPLVIGDWAWIGTRAIVLASCDSIGAGAVVGAGAIVTHDIPPHELWVGNPARFLRSL